MDDLVKQALADRIKEHDAAFTNLHREYDRRGDRIEELIEEGSVMAQKLDAAEAKLAKAVPLAEVARLAGKLGRAVEGLHDIAKEFDGPRSGLTDFGEREHYKWMACKLRDKASAVLAELKGQTDE